VLKTLSSIIPSNLRQTRPTKIEKKIEEIVRSNEYRIKGGDRILQLSNEKTIFFETLFELSKISKIPIPKYNSKLLTSLAQQITKINKRKRPNAGSGFDWRWVKNRRGLE
jgi:hypothetical protein